VSGKYGSVKMATLREKSAMVNIARTSTQIDDPHYYRYKMPLLQVIPGGQISKKKRGKTISANMSKVAKSLHRTLDELGKYLGCELATSATSAEDGTMLLGGHFDAKILQNLIPGYVEIFVLCPTCHLPETMYEISTKKKRIYHKCSACGSRNAINETDHKVYRYILAQSLHNDKSSKKKKKKKKTRTKQTRDQDDLVEVNTTKQQHRMSKDEYEADCDLEEWALTIAVHTTHRKIREQKTLNPPQLAQFVSKEQPNDSWSREAYAPAYSRSECNLTRYLSS